MKTAREKVRSRSNETLPLRYAGLSSKKAFSKLGNEIDAQARRFERSLRQCRKKFAAGRVHDLRISLRRLLALLDLLSDCLPAGFTDEPRRRLKKRLKLFNRLRDTQVQLELLLPLRRKFSAGRAYYKWLSEHEPEMVRKTRRSLRKQGRRRLVSDLEALRCEYNSQREALGLEAVSRRLFSTVNKAFAETVSKSVLVRAADAGTFHKLRVAFKRFRYMREALAVAAPRSMRAPRAVLKRYQNALGLIQDAQVLLDGFEEFARAAGLPCRASDSFSAHLRRRQRQLIQNFQAHLGQLHTFWPPQTIPSPKPS